MPSVGETPESVWVLFEGVLEGGGDGGVGEATATGFDADFAFGVGGGGVFRSGAAAFFEGWGSFFTAGLLWTGGFGAFAIFAAGFGFDDFAGFFA